jgi:hypothetical protein
LPGVNDKGAEIVTVHQTSEREGACKKYYHSFFVLLKSWYGRVELEWIFSSLEYPCRVLGHGGSSPEHEESLKIG